MHIDAFDHREKAQEAGTQLGRQVVDRVRGTHRPESLLAPGRHAVSIR